MPLTISATEYTATANASGACAFDGTVVWSGHQSGTTIRLNKFDPVSGAQLAAYTITVVGNCLANGSITFLGGFLWFLEFAGFVAKIDPATGTLVAEYSIDANVGDTVVAGTGICNDGTFLYIVFQAFRAGNSIAVATQLTVLGVINWSKLFGNRPGPFGPVFFGTHIWVNDRSDKNVYQLDLAGNITQTTNLGINLGPMIVDANFVTVLAFAGTIYQIDTTTFAVTGPFDIPTNNFPFSLVEDAAGNIWILDQDGGNVVYLHVYNPVSAAPIAVLTTDLSDTAGNLSYVSLGTRVWTPAFDALANPIMLAMLLSSPGVMNLVQNPPFDLPFRLCGPCRKGNLL